MAVSTQSSNLFWFADKLAVPDIPQNDKYNKKFRHKDTPIIIDNGSWQCRAGWGTEDQPRLVFKSLMARMRGKRGEADYTLVGNDIANVETLRSSIKNQFDKNVVINFSNQEVILDHIFEKLGLSNEASIHHPIIINEPPCNPLYCQNAMTELLFEGYNVPALSYGVDGLYNLYHMLDGEVTDALVINAGYQTTHVLPVVNGRYIPGPSKRYHRLISLSLSLPLSLHDISY
jgi:actin-related protein 5